VLQLAAENAALTEASRVAAAYDATERDALLEDIRLLRTRILSEHQQDHVGGADDVPPSPSSNQRQWLQEQLTSTQELAEQATAEGFRLARELEVTQGEKERLEKRTVELEAQTGVAEAVAQAAERKAARMAQQVEELQMAADSRVAADNIMADDGLHGEVRSIEPFAHANMDSNRCLCVCISVKHVSYAWSEVGAHRTHRRLHG
jgi:chromosome segregation ATPase